MRHLTLEEVRTIHALMIERYGGTPSERDPQGLESALAQPSAEYFGHPTPAGQAGAYLFHLCQAHAFVDGNKRTAVFAMLTFLHLNGFALAASDDDLFNLVVGVAKGEQGKEHATALLKGWLRP